MKYLLLILPFLSFGQYDKELHYGCGLFISVASGEVVYQLTDNNAMALSAGFAIGTGAGFAKEEADAISGKPKSKADILTTAWGASHGAICLRVRIDIGEKRRQRREDKEFEKFQFLKQII